MVSVVTSGVQRLSSHACSLAVHSFIRVSATNSSQPVSQSMQCPRRSSGALRDGGPEAGGQGPGTRDQGPGPFAVPVSSCRSAPDLFGRKMNHTTAHPLPLPPCHPVPHPSLPVKYCRQEKDKLDKQ